MRSEKAAINASVGIVFVIIEQILAFISRTVFIQYLSAEYLGVTSLFSNILNILNLAELGIGTAVVAALYAPFAQNNKEKIVAYIDFYRKSYFFVGLLVLFCGIGLSPLLPSMLKEVENASAFYGIYILYVIKGVSTYWLLAYKKVLFEADQKAYISTTVTYIILSIWKTAQIILLVALREVPSISFFVYCSGDVIAVFIVNLLVGKKADKTYPYIRLKSSTSLDKEDKTQLLKSIFGVSLYKVSSTINSTAGNIIISSFIGTVLLGFYSNYLMVSGAVFSIVVILFSSLTASIGNLNALGTDEQKNTVFNALQFASFWIYGFCVIAIWVLINPFIETIWLGNEYILPEITVFMMCLNYLVDGLMEAPIRFRNACGLYWQSRYRALVSAIINVSLSLIFVTVLEWGIPGVLLATIISRLTITLWIDPYIVNKHILHRTSIGFYFTYFKYLIIVLVTGGIVKFLSSHIGSDSSWLFILRLLLCIFIPNLMWWVIFRKSKNYEYLRKMIKLVISNIIHRDRKRGQSQCQK